MQIDARVGEEVMLRIRGLQQVLRQIGEEQLAFVRRKLRDLLAPLRVGLAETQFLMHRLPVLDIARHPETRGVFPHRGQRPPRHRRVVVGERDELQAIRQHLAESLRSIAMQMRAALHPQDSTPIHILVWIPRTHLGNSPWRGIKDLVFRELLLWFPAATICSSGVSSIPWRFPTGSAGPRDLPRPYAVR